MIIRYFFFLQTAIGIPTEPERSVSHFMLNFIKYIHIIFIKIYYTQLVSLGNLCNINHSTVDTG